LLDPFCLSGVWVLANPDKATCFAFVRVCKVVSELHHRPRPSCLSKQLHIHHYPDPRCLASAAIGPSRAQEAVNLLKIPTFPTKHELICSFHSHGQQGPVPFRAQASTCSRVTLTAQGPAKAVYSAASQNHINPARLLHELNFNLQFYSAVMTISECLSLSYIDSQRCLGRSMKPGHWLGF
jgi:hypothetical protein